MVEVFVDTTTGLLTTLLIQGSIFYAGILAAHRFWPDVPIAPRWAAAGIISLAIETTLFYLLAIPGMFTSGKAILPCLALATICHFSWRSESLLSRDLNAMVSWFVRMKETRGAAIFLCAGGLVLFALLRAAVLPPMSWDSLTYHDYFAGTWVQQGRLTSFLLPGVNQAYAHFPMNGDVLTAWLMLPFHSDFAINFLNFPLLALAAISIYGLSRELEVEPSSSALAAGLVCASPAVFSYVLTQYNDIAVLGELTAATLFAARYLKKLHRRDAVLAFVACGLAVGTKYTALPLAAMICVSVVFLSFKGDTKKLQRFICHGAMGVAIVVAMGGYRYGMNWLMVKNPLFPTGMTLLGQEVFPGLPDHQLLVDHFDLGTWQDDLKQIGASMSYIAPLGSGRLPMTWGPKMPLLLALACLALPLSFRWKQRWLLCALTAGWILPLSAFYLDSSPVTAISRHHWHASVCRFQAPSVALIVICAIVALSRLPWERPRRMLPTILAALLLCDMAATARLPAFRYAILGIACLLPAVVVLISLLGSWPVRTTFSRSLSLVLVTAFVIMGATGLQLERNRKRYSYFSSNGEPHPFFTEYVPGWFHSDQPAEKRTIALVCFDRIPGEHWFFYPLMGRRLQNRVVYVPAGHRKGYPPSAPDEALWKEGIREEKVSHVFVQLDPKDPEGETIPPELLWMRNSPSDFAEVQSGEHWALYEVNFGGEERL